MSAMFTALGCSLCGTPSDRLPAPTILVAGVNGGICEDCILLCAEIVAARDAGLRPALHTFERTGR